MELDTFIEGELINLCIPNEEYAIKSDWYSWFNNDSTNRFLEQGAFPNTPKDQLKFYEQEKNNRLLLVISNKSDNSNVGIISLSSINLIKKTAEIALVLSDKPRHRLAALEAMALVTQHGFEKLGLKRISAGQHENLFKWQNLLELIGYKVEGIKEGGFIKGNEVANTILIAASYNDYLNILEYREKLWDSAAKMMDRKNKLPENKLIDELNHFFNTIRKTYYNKLIKL